MKKPLLYLLVALLLLGCAGCGKAEPKDISTALTLQDMSGARIGAQEYTFHAEAAGQINKAKVSLYDTFWDMQTALENGELDGFVAEEPTAKAFCLEDSSLTYVPLLNNTTGFTVDVGAVSVAAALPEDSDLTGQINTVLATITATQKQELMNTMVNFAGGEIDTYTGLPMDDYVIPANAPALRVGMECAYTPFNWALDSGDQGGVLISSGEQRGQYAYGYDVEIARYVAHALGMRLEVHAVEWALLPDALDSGHVDAIFAGMSPVEFPGEAIAFTNPYYESQLVVVTKK